MELKEQQLLGPEESKLGGAGTGKLISDQNQKKGDQNYCVTLEGRSRDTKSRQQETSHISEADLALRAA